MTRVALLSSFVLILLAVWQPKSAEACANIIARDKATMDRDIKIKRSLANRPAFKHRLKGHELTQSEPEPAPVREASVALDEGRYDEVIAGLFAHYGLDLNGWALNPELYGWKQQRVVLLVSLAMLRSEGRFERYWEPRLSTPRRQLDNVRWAVHAMKGLARAGYAPEVNIAEAWAREPGLERSAYHKLRHRKLNRAQQELFQRLRPKYEPAPQPGLLARLKQHLRALTTSVRENSRPRLRRSPARSLRRLRSMMRPHRLAATALTSRRRIGAENLANRGAGSARRRDDAMLQHRGGASTQRSSMPRSRGATGVLPHAVSGWGL